LDAFLQLRSGFYYAAAFVTLVWVALLYPLPATILDLAVPLVIFTDLAVTGYYFIAGMVLFEKGKETLYALVSTPLRFREYLISKLATLRALAVVVSLVVAAAGYGFGFNAVMLVLGVISMSLISLLVGFIAISPFDSISSYLIPSGIPLLIMGLPLIPFLGLWESPLFYLVPTQGSLLLLGGALGAGSLAVWQILYAVFYQLLCIYGLVFLAYRTFDRYFMARKGG
jgi:fluoroquinolone transport system permease protein